MMTYTGCFGLGRCEVRLFKDCKLRALSAINCNFCCVEKASRGDEKNACEQRGREGPGPRGVRTRLPAAPVARLHPAFPRLCSVSRE